LRCFVRAIQLHLTMLTSDNEPFNYIWRCFVRAIQLHLVELTSGSCFKIVRGTQTIRISGNAVHVNGARLRDFRYHFAKHVTWLGPSNWRSMVVTQSSWHSCFCLRIGNVTLARVVRLVRQRLLSFIPWRENNILKIVQWDKVYQIVAMWATHHMS